MRWLITYAELVYLMGIAIQDLITSHVLSSIDYRAVYLDIITSPFEIGLSTYLTRLPTYIYQRLT